MPVNPFQATAEMQWGGYESKKSYRGQGQMGAGSLSGQGHRSKGWAPAAPEATLSQPRAEGRMPQGNADIKRPNYGAQTSEQPQKGSRRASFGGMGAGATKGGSGTTAGGDIIIDASQRIGSTEIGDNNKISGAVGYKASVSDSMTGGKVDQSQGFSPSTTSKAGSSRGGAGASGRGGAGGSKAGAGSGASGAGGAGRGGAGAAGRGGAGGNSARGGDTGSMNTNMSGQRMGSPVFNVGRNRIDSDNIRRESTTRTTSTDVRASGSGKASADTKSVDARKSVPMSKKGKTAKTETKPAEPANASTPKEEAATKETIKEKAKKSVAKGAAKVAAKATSSTTKTASKKTSKKTSKKEEEE